MNYPHVKMSGVPRRGMRVCVGAGRGIACHVCSAPVQMWARMWEQAMSRGLAPPRVGPKAIAERGGGALRCRGQNAQQSQCVGILALRYPQPGLQFWASRARRFDVLVSAPRHLTLSLERLASI